MLARQTGQPCLNGFLFAIATLSFDGHFSIFPPVELGDIGQPRFTEPLFQAQTNEKLCLGMRLLDLKHRIVREMIVVAVADKDSINDWDVFNVAGGLSEASRPQEADWGASVFEYRVEENSQARGKFDVVACVAKPSSTKFCRGFPVRKPLGFSHGDLGERGIWDLELATDNWPKVKLSSKPQRIYIYLKKEK